MAELTDAVRQLAIILSALPDVDVDSIDNYVPLRDTQKIALLIVPFEQSGVMEFGTTGATSRHHAHRIVCEFWIKVKPQSENVAMQRGRDICLQAMRLIALNPTLNGTVQNVGSSLLGEQGRIGSYDVLPRYEDRGQIPYVVARLRVPVELREINA